MKKVFCAFIIFTLFIIFASCVASYAEGNAKSGEELMIGDSFFFGAYEQDYDFKDDKLLLEIEPVEWIVIAKEQDKALLLSKYVIDSKPYNDVNQDISWSESSIREYLNGEFMDYCFSEAEKAAILKSEVYNNADRDDAWTTDAGRDTEDYIFLLSYKQAAKTIPFLSNSEENRKATATICAEKMSADTPFSKGVWWWLRSPGKKPNQAIYVRDSGLFDYKEVNGVGWGIRPALWLDLNTDFSTFDYEAYERVHDAFVARNYVDVYTDPFIELLQTEHGRKNYGIL